MAFLETHFSPPILGFSKLELIDFSLSKASPSRERLPTRHEIARLFSKLSAIQLIATSLTYGLGLSGKLSRRIRWQDVDLHGARLLFRASETEECELKIPEVLLNLLKELHQVRGYPVRGRVFGDKRSWLALGREVELKLQGIGLAYVTPWGALRRWGREHVKGLLGSSSPLDVFIRGPLVVRRCSGDVQTVQYYLWAVRENLSPKQSENPAGLKRQRRARQR